MQSLGFSKFRADMDLCDLFFAEEESNGKISALLDQNGFVMYFKKDDEIFGVTEDGRIVFAKLKNPDDDLPPGWTKEASFSAINLSKAITGEPAQHVFSEKDLKNIKVMDREDAAKELKNKADNNEENRSSIKTIDISSLFAKDPDEAPNFIQAKEKE